MDANEELASLSDGIVQDNVVSSYVCSMSSEIDLNLRDDLATNVQDYLGRIVDELHLISRWTAECYRYMLVCQEKEKRSEARLKRIAAAGDVESRKTTTAGFSAQQLSIQTELELLRQEMHRVHQGVTQRCASSVAYVQNSIRAENEDHLSNLQTRFDDKIRSFTQQTLEIVETKQQESETRMKSIESSIRQLQKQLQETHIKLITLEATTGTSLSNSVHVHQNESTLLYRRLENAESALSFQLNELRSSTQDSIHGLRAAQSQLSSKVQVIRLELQENSDGCHRKLQQIQKHLSNRAATHQDSSTISRLPTPAQSKRQSLMPGTPNYKQSPQGSTVSPLDAFPLDVSPQINCGVSVKIPTGATVIATPDYFIYAKAALPHKSDGSDGFSKASFPGASTRAYSVNGALFTKDVESPCLRLSADETLNYSAATGRFEDALVIQQSVLSKPLGREDKLEPFNDLPNSADRGEETWHYSTGIIDSSSSKYSHNVT
uniref:Uncharacterized protein n=1 Tax=Globisporangium ultimum (strain ATCC 200006 / CBS 805.95 / DAOM BR144) TaxID=431595 RepID=K3WP19_GLOUD